MSWNLSQVIEALTAFLQFYKIQTFESIVYSIIWVFICTYQFANCQDTANNEQLTFLCKEATKDDHRGQCLIAYNNGPNDLQSWLYMTSFLGPLLIIAIMNHCMLQKKYELQRNNCRVHIHQLYFLTVSLRFLFHLSVLLALFVKLWVYRTSQLILEGTYPCVIGNSTVTCSDEKAKSKSIQNILCCSVHGFLLLVSLFGLVYYWCEWKCCEEDRNRQSSGSDQCGECSYFIKTFTSFADCGNNNASGTSEQNIPLQPNSSLEDMDLSRKERNFVKLSYILLNIVTNHFREFFVKKWNDKYPKEQWNNDNTSGEGLCTKITINIGNVYMEKIKSGDVQKWDIATLGIVFLFSGLELIPKDSSEIHEVDNIRKIRNEYLGHPNTMACSDVDFVEILARIKKSAKILFRENVVNEIDEIEKSPSDKKNIENMLKLLMQEVGKIAELSEKLNIIKDNVEELQTGQEKLQVGQEELQTGQEKLQTGQEKLQTGQGKLQIGQEKLQIGQEKLQVGQEKLQVGQEKLQVGQEKLQVGQEKLHIGQEKLLFGQEKFRASLEKLQVDHKELQTDLEKFVQILSELTKKFDDNQVQKVFELTTPEATSEVRRRPQRCILK